MKILVLGLTLLLASAEAQVSAHSAAWDQSVPLTQPFEQVQALIGIHRTLPSLFSDAVTYDRDLLELLETQGRLEREVQSTPLFRQLSQTRGALIDLVIGQDTTVSTSVQTIDPSAIFDWRANLLAALRGLSASAQQPADSILQNEIRRVLKSGLAGRSQGIITGLINLLPSARRSDVFKQTYVQQVETLKRELPSDVINAGFRASAYGWTDSALDVTTVLARLQSARDAELHLSSLLQIQLVLQTRTGTIDGRMSDVAKRLSEADESSLSALVKPEEFAGESGILKNRLIATDPSLEKPLKLALGLVQSQVRAIVSDTIVTRQEFETRLVLREVPPQLAIFRGFAGNDCATEKSFAIGNSPNERVFFVLDRGGGIKGYMAMTSVTTRSGPALYLHTINGPNLNANDAEAIIRAVFQARQQLGASQVVIPLPSQVHANVNFSELRAAFERLASPESMALTYTDAALRSALKRYMPGANTYDDPEQNRTGRLVDGQKIAAAEVKFQIRASEASAGLETPAARGDLLLMALSLSASGRTLGRTWTEVLRMGNLSDPEILQLDALIRNVERLPLETFYANLKTSFATYGLALDADTISRNWALFIKGHMEAPDALEPKNSAATGRLISLAISKESIAILEEIMDVHGPYIIAQPKWRDRIARSDELSALLLSRLSLLERAGFAAEARAEIDAKILNLSPLLPAFYQQLKAARTAEEFLKRVPPGQFEKAPFVHHGVRSALDQFLAMNPTAEQVRNLAIAMHDFEELFHIQEKVILRVKTAADFLRLTDYVYRPPPEFYRLQTMKFLMTKVDDFFRLNPTPEEVNEFRRRINTTESDLLIVRKAVARATSAADFLSVVGLYGVAPGAKEMPYHGELKALLKTNIATFLKLEPSVSELKAFRYLIWDLEVDIKLMEAMAPKITRAADFVKMVTLYGKDSDPKPDVYSERLRDFMQVHLDMFLSLSPSAEEINAYRKRIFRTQAEATLLPAALERAKTSEEFVQAATLLGREPTSPPSAYDRLVSGILISQIDRFLHRKPTVQQLESYRARMANPIADLKLVDASLASATTAADFLRALDRRPLTADSNYAKARIEVLAKHFQRFAGFERTVMQSELYLSHISDPSMAQKMRPYLRPTDTGMFSRLRARLGSVSASTEVPSFVQRPAPPRCELLFSRQ